MHQVRIHIRSLDHALTKWLRRVIVDFALSNEGLEFGEGLL